MSRPSEKKISRSEDLYPAITEEAENEKLLLDTLLGLCYLSSANWERTAR